MVYKLVFRIRRIYFDQIVARTKHNEVRKKSKFWDVRVENATDALLTGERVEGVFISGMKVHRTEIDSIMECPSAKDALGREPSEQGKSDCGDGEVYSFHIK
jgi:hypothetical protein